MSRTQTLRVRDVMTSAPETVDPDSSLAELIGRFEQLDVNAFPVVESGNVLCGLVTKLDVVRLLRPLGDAPLAEAGGNHVLRARNLMRRDPVTTRPPALVTEAAELLLTSGLQSLPVVQDDDRRPVLVGVISRGDVLRALLEELRRHDEAAPAPAARGRRARAHA